MSSRSTPPRGFFPGSLSPRKKASVSSPGGTPSADTAGGAQVVPLKAPARYAVPLSPDMRLKALLNRPDAKTLVRQAPVQDLFLLVKQVGLSDVHELLELASFEQVQHMIDMDVWEKADVKLDNYGEWLRAMVEIHQHDLAPLLNELDPELLLLFLQDHMKVYLKEDDLPEPEQLEMDAKNVVSTSDFAFLLEFSKDDDWQEFIFAFLDRVYAVSMKTAHWLLSAVQWEQSSHLEEQGYRLRTGRMEALGFLDFYEAQGIYQPLRESTALPRVKAPRPHSGPLQEVPLPMEQFRPSDGSLLTRTLEHLQEVRPDDDFSHDLLHLSNKVIAADQLDPGDLEHLQQALEQVHAYVNLGLELEAEGEVTRAAQALLSTHVEWLFRRGFTEVLTLKRRASGLLNRLKGSWRPIDVLPDSPWREHFDGLMKPRPQRVVSLTGSEPQYGPFSTPLQLAQTRQMLTELDVIRRFVFELLAPEPCDIKALRRSLAESNVDLTPQAVFLTSLSQRMVGGTFSPLPLRLEQLGPVLDQMFLPSTGSGVLRLFAPAFLAQLDEAVRAWQQAETETSAAANAGGDQTEIVQKFVRQCVERVRDSLGGYSASSLQDPRFIEGPLLINLR